MVQFGVESEDGWRPAKAGPDILEWIAIPGSAVTLRVMKGWPSQILRAYAADYNAYVEPLRDADSASFTATNSVATSNHLNGTAMDLNWNSHPFQVSNAGYTPQMIATMREILDFYEGTMFWAQDWNSPKDAMHHQMGYGTWNNPATGDFIKRKIRADGYSTFRRGGTVPPPQLSKADQYALAVIRAGQKRSISRKGICIALCVPPVETNWRNLANSGDPETKALPNDGVGADHDSAGIFQQRRAWGPATVRMNPELSAGLFYDGGAAGQRGLTDFNYDDPNAAPGEVAADVQQPAAQYRYRYAEHWDDANALYDRLNNLEGDDMANVPQDQWDWVYNELHKQFTSRAMYGTPDEDTFAGRAVSAHAFAWEDRVESSALRGEPWAIELVVKATQGANQFLVNHALAVLAEIEAKNPSALQQFVNGAS